MGFLELAELLKWPAIVAGAVAVLALVRRWIRKGGADARDLKQAAKAHKKKGEASEDLRKTTGRLGNLWRAGRLRKP